MRARCVTLLVATVVATSLTLVAGPALPAGAAVPAGFTDQLVTAVSLPTAMAFTPDRRMLVTTQPGTVRVVQGGALLAAPAIDLSAQICSSSERGLLGVAVDPLFATNGFVYLYYSFKKTAACDSATVNRVSRFVMTGNTLGGEVVLIDNIPSPAGNHNAGDLQFGKDQTLYVSVGDGGCDYPGGTPSGCQGSNDAARDRNALVGKVLRVDRNGNIPADNPFQGAGTVRCNASGVVATNLVCQETFAWGLRNPYRIAVDPNVSPTRLYINDVGLSSWEEIDQGAAGADYGWNVREGHCAIGSTTDCGPPPAGMTNPIFDYGRADGCRTITGGAFVPNGVWPAGSDAKYLFADYACGKIFRLDPSGGGGFTRTDFATGLGSNTVVHLAFGPWRTTQALYYLTFAAGGQIRRIVHTAGSTAGDYDRDGDAERGVFRPATGAWHIEGAAGTSFLGLNGDVPVPADYDGDGDTDLAVYRPTTGAWYIAGTPSPVFWGLAGDRPVPADYDGDGAAEIAVWRPSTGAWFVEGGAPASWGFNGDVPVPGDYDGDGRADLAVFRPATGAWYVRGAAGPVFLGLSGDLPTPADYDGDGDSDVAVFRPGTGAWFVAGAAAPVFLGLNGDVPVPADYDGDADADIAVFHPATGAWYVQGGPSPTFLGLNGDIPLPRPVASL